MFHRQLLGSTKTKKLSIQLKVKGKGQTVRGNERKSYLILYPFPFTPVPLFSGIYFNETPSCR